MNDEATGRGWRGWHGAGGTWLRRCLFVAAWLTLVAVGQTVMGWQIERFAMHAYRIPSSAMEPTLHCAPPAAGCEGDTHDRVIVLRFERFWTPGRGDIIAFDAPSKVERRCGAGGHLREAHRRPAGREGRAAGRSRPRVRLHRRPASGGALRATRKRGGFGPAGPLTIPQGQYFLLGDNRGPVVRFARVRLGAALESRRPGGSPLLAPRTDRFAVNADTSVRQTRLDWLAILSFVLAALWLFGIGSLLALDVGRRSLRRMKAHRDLRGRTVAWAGVALAVLGCAYTALWLGLSLTA